MKSYIIFLLFIILASCNKSNSLYLENITIINQNVPEVNKKSVSFDLEFLATPNIAVYDSLLICYNIKPIDNCFFSIYNIKEQKLLGNFCLKGRGSHEMINTMLLRQVDVIGDGEIVADLYAYNNNKLLTWNITKSLESESTVYDEIIPVDWKQYYKSICRFNFRINDDIKVLHIPVSTISINKLSPMHYSVFSSKENKEIKNIPIFKKAIISNTPYYSTEMLSYTEDCVKPDKTKIAFGMTYAPIFGILDIESGHINTFSLEKSFNFSDLTEGAPPIWHFKNLQADENKIYALYHGDYEPRTGKAKSHDKSIVYVLDWSGKLLEKLILDREVYCIALDRAKSYLYGVNPSIETLYRYQL